jgi:GxxExxY protein
MKQIGMKVLVEQKYEIVYRQQKIGHYIADLVIDNLVIVELKCCKSLSPEHQAQVINYLKASGRPVGILVNFGNQKLEYRRLHHPNHLLFEEKVEVALPWEKHGLIT